MYVSTCKGGANGQYTYVRLMESYRDENGKVKHLSLIHIYRHRPRRGDQDFLEFAAPASRFRGWPAL